MDAPAGGRTIVLGADSLDLLLVERWAAQGLLPFFQSMLRTCSLVRLSAVSRVLQGALWPDLLSGRSPGDHATYYLTQLTRGTYNLDQIAADHMGLDPYYRELDANGVRCAIVDIPNDMPIEGFGGLHVVDWLTEFKYWRFATQPVTRKPEIERRIGALNGSGGYGPTVDSLEGHRLLRRRLERSIAMKARLTNELLAQADHEHVFVVFAEAHKAGHFLWKYMDSTHPDHVESEPYLRDALLSIYQVLDRQFERLSQRLTPRDNLLLFSDHGMQANYRGDQFVAPVLQRLGLYQPERTALRDHLASAPALASHAASGARSALRRVVKAVAPRFAEQRMRRQFGAASQVDWSRTRAFPLPTDRNSYLRINLRGREPEGIVAPGKEYDTLLALIESEFRALVNVHTGQPAVEEVFRVHELYPGPRAHELPDIAILWRSEAPIDAVESASVGRIEQRVREDRSGNHRPGGFLLARGPGIQPGMHGLRGDVLQIPSTLLALHGIGCPDAYAMAPLDDLLAPALRDANPRALPPPGAPRSYSSPGTATAVPCAGENDHVDAEPYCVRSAGLTRDGDGGRAAAESAGLRSPATHRD